MKPRRSGRAGQVPATLGALARACSDVEEGVACVGTALESRTFKVKNKAFLFVRAVDARLKLKASAAEAARLAAKDPTHYNFGASGWATLRFGGGHVPARPLLARWVKESHGLLVGASPSVARGKAET